MTEVRVRNEKTGGEKGQKAERWDLIPWEQLAETARLYALGAKKYAAHNWALGYNWSLSYAAMMRHATEWWNGESTHEVVEGDPDSRCHHMASVVFHALALMFFEKYHPDLDDRPCRTVPVLIAARQANAGAMELHEPPMGPLTDYEADFES